MPPRRRPRNVAAVALWPGAGSSAGHPTLVAIEQALAAGPAPVPVFRFDFPYRREGRRAPDRAPKLITAIGEEVARIAHELGVGAERIVLGGRSMGGRMCSMAVAEGLPAAGVILIAYPLHPPGKADRLRTEHLPDLVVPSLWLCGDRDPFGTPGELADAQALVAGPVTSVTLPGGHDLKGDDERIVAEVRDWLGGPRPTNRGGGPR